MINTCQRDHCGTEKNHHKTDGDNIEYQNGDSRWHGAHRRHSIHDIIDALAGNGKHHGRHHNV